MVPMLVRQNTAKATQGLGDIDDQRYEDQTSKRS